MQEFDDIINEINSTHNKFEKHKLCKELRNRTIFNETDTQNQAKIHAKNVYREIC